MKRSIFILTLLTCLYPEILAQTPVMPEMDVVFETLCQHPSRGWIEYGRIEALHESFDSETGQTTKSRETVVTDGNRFSWDIHIESLKKNGKSIQPKTNEFLQWNQDRRFIWDGQAYTLYFKSGNHAITQESPEMPVAVNGPLTAGHIPWGYGLFTLENLSNASVSAILTENAQIQCTLDTKDSPEIQLTLDTQNEYAVQSCTIIHSDNSRTVHTYGNFIRQGERLVPMNILVERFRNGTLHASDMWEILEIQTDHPEPDNFTGDFEEKTLVELYTPVLDKPAFYKHSKQKNIKSLLNERYMTDLKKTIQPQNCGTAALRHILKELDADADDQELSALVDEDSGQTSLYQLQQFVQEKDLYCLPVKTDIETLRQLKNSTALIHLPAKKHFVILDRIDDDTVWLIDLDRQTFYHCMPLDEFQLQWVGIAMIIAKHPLSLSVNDKPIPDAILKRIMGAADYTCREISLDEDDRYVNCPEPIGNLCIGRYEVWLQRYICKPDSDGGFCSGTGMAGRAYSECIEKLSAPGTCTITGKFTSKYMRGCLP